MLDQTIIPNLLDTGSIVFGRTILLCVYVGFAYTIGAMLFRFMIRDIVYMVEDVKAGWDTPAGVMTNLLAAGMGAALIAFAGKLAMDTSGHGYDFILPDEIVATFGMLLAAVVFSFLVNRPDDPAGIVESIAKHSLVVFVTLYVSAQAIVLSPTIGIGSFTAILLISGLTSYVVVNWMVNKVSSIPLPSGEDVEDDPAVEVPNPFSLE